MLFCIKLVNPDKPPITKSVIIDEINNERLHKINGILKKQISLL